MKEKQTCWEKHLLVFQISDPTLPMKATKGADRLSWEVLQAPFLQPLSPANLPPRAPGSAPGRRKLSAPAGVCEPCVVLALCRLWSGRPLRTTCSETPTFQGCSFPYIFISTHGPT